MKIYRCHQWPTSNRYYQQYNTIYIKAYNLFFIAAERIHVQFIANRKWKKKFNSWPFMWLSWFQSSRLYARKFCRLPAMSSHLLCIHVSSFFLFLFRLLIRSNPIWTINLNAKVISSTCTTLYINSDGRLAFIDSLHVQFDTKIEKCLSKRAWFCYTYRILHIPMETLYMTTR